MSNGQLFAWSNIETGAPQCSILGSMLFLIYIDNLSDGFTTNARPFADNVPKGESMESNF